VAEIKAKEGEDALMLQQREVRQRKQRGKGRDFLMGSRAEWASGMG
jgi:hypothetical protein